MRSKGTSNPIEPHKDPSYPQYECAYHGPLTLQKEVTLRDCLCGGIYKLLVGLPPWRDLKAAIRIVECRGLKTSQYRFEVPHTIFIQGIWNHNIGNYSGFYSIRYYHRHPYDQNGTVMRCIYLRVGPRKRFADARCRVNWRCCNNL